MDQYRCRACHKDFLPSQAIDGFKQGFSQGFLCPYCRCNLIEAGESDDIIHLKYGLTYMAFMLILWLLVDQRYIAYTWPVSEFINDLVTMAAVMSLPTVLFVWVNRMVIFSSRVIYTRKVIANKTDKKE